MHSFLCCTGDIPPQNGDCPWTLRMFGHPIYLSTPVNEDNHTTQPHPSFTISHVLSVIWLSIFFLSALAAQSVKLPVVGWAGQPTAEASPSGFEFKGNAPVAACPGAPCDEYNVWQILFLTLFNSNPLGWTTGCLSVEMAEGSTHK